MKKEESKEIMEYLSLAEECLEEAKSLLSNGFYRGTASRAYYSMYHAAKALPLTRNITLKKHAGVLRMLGLEFVNKGYLERKHISSRSTLDRKPIMVLNSKLKKKQLRM